jgi:N-acetylglucosamine-6-phosphate deacetylase
LKTGTITGRQPASGQTIKITIADGKIAAIEPADTDEKTYLAPGLIDLQVNGFEGHDMNSGHVTPDDVSALAASLRNNGVTTFVPTLITASEESILSALEAIAVARAREPILAHSIPYVHVEGPWLSPEDGPRGAHPREHVRAPDLAEFKRWQAACGGLVGMITLSPHYPGTVAVIAELTAAGVHVALGHTGATPEEIRAAVDAGATISTHLGNGAAAMLARHPNHIWAQLADDRLWAGFIADGHHLDGDTFKAMLRAKGLDRSFLVSDATTLGGMAPGLYQQNIGGTVELTEDGRLGIAGTPYLAGAALPLCDGVARAVKLAKITIGDAVRLATANPGGFVGVRGRLEVGADADLIRFLWEPGQDSLTIDQVLIQGDTP